MPLYGRIVVIKRDGTDGAQFHLTSPVCTFGRDSTCDIRVQLPSVAKEHCRIEVDDASRRIFLVNLCEIWPTQLNKAPVAKRVELKHQDVFTVTERSFRLEFPPGSPLRDNCLEDASSVNDKKPAFKMTPNLSASCKRKTMTPVAAWNSSVKTSVVTPGRAVKSSIRTPVSAAKYSRGRTSGAGVAAASAAKAKAAGASLSRKSDLLSAEIAELKSSLLKAKEKTAATKPTAIVKPTTTPIAKVNSFVAASARMVSSTPMLKTPSAVTGMRASTPDTLSKLSCSRGLTTSSTKLLAGSISMINTPRTNLKASVQPLSSRIHQVRKTISPKMSAKRRSSGVTPGANKGRKYTAPKQIAEGKLAASECKNLDSAFEGSCVKDTTADQNLKGLEMSAVKNVGKSSCQALYPDNAPGYKLKAIFDDSFGSAAKRHSSPASSVRRSSSLTALSGPRTSEPRSARRARSSTPATSASPRRKSKSLSKSPVSSNASKRSPSPRVLNSPSGSDVKSPRLSSGRKSRSPTKTPTVNSGRKSSPGANILNRHSNAHVISPRADSLGSGEPSFGLDDTDGGSKSARKKSDRINSSMPKDSDPGSLRTKVNHLRRKSTPLVEESEPPLVRAGISEAEIDFAFTNESIIQDKTSSEKQGHNRQKSASPLRKGVKRPGSPLKGRQPKRCVSFGPEISPELFHQDLPTKTPLKRGATPRRVSISVDRVEQRHKPLLKKRFSSIPAIEESRSSESVSLNREQKPVKTKSEMSPLSARVSNSSAEIPGVKTPADESTPASSSAVASASGSQQKRQFFTSGIKTTRTATGRLTKSPLASGGILTPMSASNKSPSRAGNLKEVQNVDPFVYESSPDSSPSRAAQKIQLSVSATYRASLGEQKSICRGSLEPESGSLVKSRRKSKSKSEENISSPLFSDDVKSPVRKRSPTQATPKGSRNLSPSSASRISDEMGSTRSRTASSEKKPPKRSGEPLAEFTGLDQIQIQLLNNEEFSKGTLSRVESIDRRRSKSLLRRSFANSFDDSSQNEEDLTKSAKSNRKSGLLAESLNSPKMNAADEGVNDGVFLDKFGQEIEDLFAAVKIKPSRVATPKVVSSKASPKSPKGRKSLRRSSLHKISYESPEYKKVVKILGAENSETLTHSETVEPSVQKPTSGRKSYLANKSSVRKTNVGAANVSVSLSKLPFRRSFGSEPKKLHTGKTGRLSLEAAKTATRTRKPAKMVSERNVDLANISPLKFYRSPATETAKQRRSKVTPGRAVALRAVFGKAALPSLSQLQKSKKASPSSEIAVTKLDTPVEKLNSGEADPAVRKHTVNKNSKVPCPVKLVTMKTGFAVKNKPTKLVLKPKSGGKPFGKIAGKILAVRKVKQRQLIRKPDAVQKTTVAAETELIEVLYNKEDSESSVSHLTVETPPGPGEMFVSPWSTPTPDKNPGNRRSGRKHAGSNDTSGSKRESAPRADTRSPLLSGLKSLVKTPKVQASPRLSGVKAMMKTPVDPKSPVLGGFRELMETVKIPESPRFGGLREMLKTPKVQKSPRLAGIKAMMKLPKIQKSPQLNGVRKLVKTPKVQKSPDLRGVREMVKTPKVQQSPRLSGVRQLVKSPKQQKSPKLSGLKTLTKTPKVQTSPDLRNLKSLFNTVKEMKTPRLDGLRVLLAVPKSQLSPDYTGLAELVATPPSRVVDTPKISRGRKTPRGGGAKKSAKTPATKPSPRLSGVRKLVKTPKVLTSPDFCGIQQLVQTPDVEQSTMKKARGKAGGVRTPLARENLHQSPLLKTGSAKGKGRTRSSVKVSQELMPVAASELSPVSPQVVTKTKRASKNARGTSADKENLELSLNTQGVDVGIDGKFVRNKRRRSDSEAVAVSKKRRLNESGISDTEAGIATETEKDFEPMVRKTRRNKKLDAVPSTTMQNVEVDALSAKTPSKGRGRSKPTPKGSRAPSKVLPTSDVGPVVEPMPRNRRGKKQPVEEEELVSVVPQGRVKNSRTKKGSKKNSENEIPSVVSAVELPKRHQRKPIPNAAENGNEAVGGSSVVPRNGKKASLKASINVEVLMVEAVKSNGRGHRGKSVSVEALVQNGYDGGKNEKVTGKVVANQSKTVEKLSVMGRSRREQTVEVVAIPKQTTAGGRRGNRTKKPVADSLNKQVTDQDTVDPTAHKRGTGKRRVAVVEELGVVVQESDRAGRRQPAARGRRLMINDVAAYLADILLDTAEHDNRPQSRQSKNEESKNRKGKVGVEAARKSPLNKGSRKRKGVTEPVEAEIKTKRTRVAKAEEVLEAGSASRKGRGSVKISSVTIDGQNDGQESNLALRNERSRRGLSDESDLKSVVDSKKPKDGRNAKPAATAAKLLLQSPKNTKAKAGRTVPSNVTDTSAVDAKSKFRSRKVAFDVPPTPVVEASAKKRAKESAKGKAVSKKTAANRISQESVSSPRKGRASAAVTRKSLRSARK